MSLSERVRRLRQRSLMNQESFAGELNVSLITIHRWESGKSLPNLSAMRALKEFCRRKGLPYTALEKDWLAERTAEKRQKREKKAGAPTPSREKVAERITGVKEILAMTGERLVGKCEEE